jgi:predicted TIM-barrel fold metal-dependent hydrolase
VIVDVHTHTMDAAAHLSPRFVEEADRARGFSLDLTVTREAYLEAMAPVERCIVFGMKARLCGFYMPNDDVARFVSACGGNAMGFLSVDPADDDWLDDFERSRTDLGLSGIKLAPMYAGFEPTDRKLDELYRRAERLGMPVLFHFGTTFCAAAPLAYARPGLADEIARRFPELRIVIAHLGHPWEGEALVTARKHPHVYCDISALHYRPWQFYNSIVLAQEYRVTHKLLFGSDFPFTSPRASIDAMRAMNAPLEGTRLPRIAAETVEGIIHRDSLSLLFPRGVP